MKNWEFKRIKLTDEYFRRPYENLNAFEYRYRCVLDDETYLLTIMVTTNYKKFSFNFQNTGTKEDNVILREPDLAYLISVDEKEFPDELQRLGFILNYIKRIFPVFKFEDSIEL